MHWIKALVIGNLLAASAGNVALGNATLGCLALGFGAVLCIVGAALERQAQREDER